MDWNLFVVLGLGTPAVHYSQEYTQKYHVLPFAESGAIKARDAQSHLGQTARGQPNELLLESLGGDETLKLGLSTAVRQAQGTPLSAGRVEEE